MRRVHDADSARQRDLSNEMELRLGELVSSFAAQHGLSGLSATTLALQMIVAGIYQFGGAASKAYVQSTVDIMSCRDERTAHKINDRARKAMERMAERYDAKVKEFGGRTIQ